MIERARIAFPILLTLFSLSGCKSVKYVPIETIRTDTCLINSIKIDSVYCRDSVYVERMGESVTTYRYKYMYKHIDKHDTIYIHKTDTVTKTITIKGNSPVKQVVDFLSDMAFALIFFGLLYICLRK
jgi:hypothetical protein